MGGAARVFGWLSLLCGAAGLALFAVAMPEPASLALAGGLLLSGIAAFAERRRADKRAAEQDRVIDVISGRLLAVEASAKVAPIEPVRSDPAARIETLSEDVGLLGGAMRTLADAMSDQEREIEGLKGRLAGAVPAATDVPESDPPPVEAEPLVLPSLFRRLADPEPLVSDPAQAARLRREAIAAALRAGRIELHLQPVVSLPQRRPQFREALARLRLADGTLLQPAEFIPAAERLDMLGDLDELVLTEALALARTAQPGAGGYAVSFNLSPSSLEQPAILDRLSLIASSDAAADRLVVELPQRSWTSIVETPSILAPLRRARIGFAMDRVSVLTVEADRLARVGLRFVKLPADRLLAADPLAGAAPEDLVAYLTRHRIQAIADRVERDAIVPELIEIGVPLAQGYLFGLPAAEQAGDAALPLPDPGYGAVRRTG